MATNIEQIFRSFVVSKFREIQQQQLGSGKLGQPNGEIDSSEQVNSADDSIASIGVLQNDPLVQKIEQVLSEVLGAEPQYKPDAGQDTVKNKSRSTKRGIPDEVQDEIPRKKSKKDKKHKDKKKKKRKKEKKEKKYKKQSKESKLNSDHKGCEDIQPASCLNSESLVLSAENVGSTSPLKHDSEWFVEKTVYENVNSSLSNLHDASNSDTSKLYASEEDSVLINIQEEDSVLINIQELCEVQVTNERELENDICQHTNLVVNIPVEDEFLKTAIEGDNTCVKEVEQAETGSALQTAENINVPENSPKFMTVELEDLETRVELHSVEGKELDSLSESLDPEIMTQPESISFEKTECKFMKTHLETIVEAKDSVTTLGFLAMVVGKDFEATSEFLNKAKVKVSGRSPKDDAKGMKDELEQDPERIAMMKELEKTLQTESRLEMKDLEEISATEKGDSERISESDERKSIDASVEPETIRVGELKETQTPAIVIKLNDPLKYQKSVEPEMRDFRRISELEVMKRADSRAYILDKKVETKNVEAAAESEEMVVRCLSGTSVCESEKEKWDNIPERMGLKNLSSPEFAGAVRVNYLEASLETEVEKKDDMVVTEDSKMAVEVKVSESTPRSEMTPETLKITKTQYLDFSKQVTVTDIEGETDINLKDLKKVPEQPSVTLKNLETVSEMQHLPEMKHVKNVLQSDVTTQGKNLESNLKPEGQREDKDLDAASESLHMIFTNYSEHSLELYTEPEAMMEVKNSEKVPELLPMEDVNNSEALSTMEVKGLKTIESTTVVKLNDLGKKIEYLHRGVKNRGTESKTLTDVKYLETYVQSEPGTKERDKKIPSYSVIGVKEKALDTTESLGKGQYGAETTDWKIKSGCLSMEDITEKEPSAEIKSPLFISESFQEVSILNSETSPEVDAVPGMQELKETGRYTPVLEVDSPDTPAGLEMSALIDPKDASKLLNTAEDFESISGYQVVENLDSLQFANDQAINFGSQCALQVKYTVSSPKLLFSDELTNLQERQKLEESTEAASFTTAPESPDTSGTELIVASESGEVHEVIDVEHSSKSTYMKQANSDNFLKSLYTMHLKGSKTISQSKIMDAKNLEIEPEYSHREDMETEHFSEYESVASSQVLEISEESPKKTEMQESNTAFGSKALTVSGLEVNSETLCAINIDNLEVVKKAHVAPTSLGMISTEGTRIPVSAMEDKDIKASETVKTKVEVKHLLASTTPVGIARETFHPIHVTDSEVSEASQMLETNLESVHKKEVNTKLDHEAALSGSEIFKKPKPVIGTSTTEGMLPVINIAEENESGTDLKPEAALVEKYSESVSESNKVSDTKDCDAALSLFMVDVKDSELRSDFLDAGQVKTLNTTVQFETTSEPLCVLELGNSDDVVESVLTTEMKELGETLNCEVVLEAKDSGPTVTNLITSELKPSESLCVLEITNSEGIIELTPPAYLSSAHLKPSDKTAEIEALDSDSEAPLKSEMDVKYFESVSVSDCVLEQFHYKTVPESEYVLEGKVSETSELVSMKRLEAIPEPKHAQERKDLEPLVQSVCAAQATCLEKNLVYAEVRDVSETTPKFSGIMEIKDLGATMSSVLAETEKKSDENLQLYFEEKCSETATECIHMPDLMETSVDVESVCRIEGNYAEMARVIDNENSKANSGLTSVTELKDTAFVKSKTGPEPEHLKDHEAVPNSESLGKVKDMQIAQSSIDKKEGMYFEGSSESVLILERQDLERDSTSVLGSEVDSEESLKSVPAVKAKDSEVALKYIDANGVEVAEQNTKYVCMGEMKDLPSVLEHVELAQAKSSEMFSKGPLEGKNLEAAMCLAKEKKSEATVLASLEEQILKASLEPICGAEKNNLVVSQQVMREIKDSEAASESVNMSEKEASSCISLKDQHSEAVPESSEITKKNDDSISKDRKSEKVSSKSKDKSKSGKKTKKSRSKSPSKSKKRKKKSRSRSTSRQMSSRRARSRSKNDSDSRKKHSTSRRRSRSNSAEKKESKERSLRSGRRRSRTSDRHKSRSKSVDKRETSLRSRRRHSRSSDRRKSRSRSIDRRESIRTRRRLSRSSDNRKSRSKSYDRREILIRSRRRLSRSSDRHKSRSRSTDKRETIRTRRRRSRSSEYHKSRSRSVEKRETSVRRRRRRSRSSDNYKSRSKSVDRRESPVRSRRRRSRSSDHHKSRSRSVDDKREISVRTRRKRSRSSENHRSQSKSVEKRESLRPRRRRSRSSDNRKSRSKSGDKETPRTRRRRSRSSDNRKTRSNSVDKRESSVRARRRRSRSSDRKSRSKSVDKRESSVRAKRRRSRSSDNKSRSKSVDRRETSTRAKDRRSRSSDNCKSRSKSVDKRETSTRAKRRRSRSCDNRKSRSKSVDKRESSVRARKRRSRSSDNCKSRSKSFDKRETSARSKRKRSRSSENCKSRSKSVDKTEVSGSSKRRRSKSSDHKPVTKASEKRDSSLKSGLRRSKSSDRQKSKSKSRSKSSERKKDKDSSDVTKGKGSKSRSKSKSPEKTEATEVSEATVHSHAKSPEHPKSKSRSRSKSLDKTRDRPRRSRSKCSEPKSHSHRTVSRSRRNRSRSLTRKRTSRSKSDNRSRSRSRSRSCSRRWRRSRSRSVSRQRSLSRERRRRSRRNRSRSVDRRRRRSDSRDSYRIPLRLRSRSRTPVQLRTSRSAGRRRSTSVSPDHRRSRSASRSPKRLTDLDKAQLLEIAKANAAAMCAKAGVPLPPSLMPVATPEKKEEKVTQKSAKETIMELTEKCKKIAQSQEDDVILNKPHVSDEEEEEHPFINHPFKLSEPKPIFFNLTTPTIKPAPPKNQVTLTKEFPVSSGSQHRKKEADSAYGEWVPVEKNKEENKDDVFPNPATLEPVDISSALSERTIAQKRLTENTFDLEAMCLLNRAQERIDAWAQLNSLPGQFTGSTGAQVLSSEQLSNSGPQAWIKKDQFLRAAPVTGGMGAQLMRKMGWREGEGLGKNKEGSREPILVDFKTDRKGLVAVGEKTQKRHGAFSGVKDLAGKHPISVLVEACNKRRWPPPTFVLVTDNGPDHRKCFLFKVMVNGVEHKPTFASPNKKLAKTTAATVALQALGIVPKELLVNATSFRSASHN